MAQTNVKSEVVPVKNEKAADRRSATHLLTPFEDMERWIEELFPRSWLHDYRWGRPSGSRLATALDVRIPKVDIIDRDSEIFIKVELPGVDKKDVEVSMTDNTITIKGSSKREEKEEKGEYYRCEITQGTFSRSMSLPAEVDIDKSQAKFKDGILELRLPKVANAKRRNIKVD